MACKITENNPLKRLREDLGLPRVCHSLRGDCIMSLTRLEGDYAMAAPGASVGYCQGLFNRSGTPSEHTNRVVEYLNDIGAPMPNSHELYLGYRNGETIQRYIEDAVEPLKGTGRVPVIITDFDPATDYIQIGEVLKSRPAVCRDEPVLVRINLGSEDSIQPATDMLRKLLEDSKRSRRMPRFWPLLQGELDINTWNQLRGYLGDEWKYVNVAATPFTSEEVMGELGDNIAVAQFLVGGKDGIHPDGTVSMNYRDCTKSGDKARGYNIFEYADKLQRTGITPTNIICGPSAGWNDDENRERVRRILSHFREATKVIWDIDDDRHETVFSLQAWYGHYKSIYKLSQLEEGERKHPGASGGLTFAEQVSGFQYPQPAETLVKKSTKDL